MVHAIMLILRKIRESEGNVPDGDLLTETWTAATSEMWAYSSATGAKNRKLLSSFYVAERTFRPDYSIG